VQLLLENGAEVNAQGTYGNALHAASLRGHNKIVQLLMVKGAQGGEDRNTVNKPCLW
jgi:ankyrin repeat protein